ncbi:hypothetical protein [Streptomyces sp. NPDC007007]|uniref:hypothetical protein n=1 Tax=Streptomyces sp. NPDC007007 TaxID=3364770 RepID=UPI0036A85D62
MSGFPGWGEEEWGPPAFGGTAESTATEKYTVTLPEELREAGLHGRKYAVDAALAAIANRQQGRTAPFTSDVGDMGKLCAKRVQVRGL